MNVIPLRIAGTYQSRYSTSRNGDKLVSSASRKTRITNTQLATALFWNISRRPIPMALDKHDKVQYLHDVFCTSRMENEDDGSAPTVLGIPFIRLIKMALIYCDHRESYMRNFSSFLEIVSSQAS